MNDANNNEKVEVFVTISLLNGEQHKTSFKLEGTATKTVENWMKRFSKEDDVYTYIYNDQVTSFKFKDVVSVRANLQTENKNFTLSDIAEEVRQNFKRWNNPDLYN